jgi:hypothetical protein
VIPLVIGVISASGKGGGGASPISVLIAAVGVFALGWIVSSFVLRARPPAATELKDLSETAACPGAPSPPAGATSRSTSSRG